MLIAILGANSQIAKDLIRAIVWAGGEDELFLYARRPAEVASWLSSIGLVGHLHVAGYEAFGAADYDAIINFVGVGDPARAVAMGAAVFDVTLQYDQLALDYLRHHPDCRYLFLSSGAVYGSSFDEPVDENAQAVVAINSLQPQDWYGVAKLHAECRHRALTELPIIDLRVFSYFSRTQDVSARFLMTDIVRALRDAKVLMTSPDRIVRDFLHPQDFHALVSAVLASPPANTPIDCYSRAPIDKCNLLEAMKDRFGLQYEFGLPAVAVNATGLKFQYYSLSRRAEDFGYHPTWTSLEGLMQEVAAMLNPKAPHSNE